MTTGILRFDASSGNRMFVPHKGGGGFEKLTDDARIALKGQYAGLPREDQLRWCINTAAEFGLPYGRFVSAVGI